MGGIPEGGRYYEACGSPFRATQARRSCQLPYPGSHPLVYVLHQCVLPVLGERPEDSKGGNGVYE